MNTAPASNAPSGASARRPSVGSGRSQQNIAVDRAALGLGSLKPSEMIKGLDKVAERAAKLEEREEAKRKAGGRMSDSATLTDDTGRRWSRNVNLGIFGIVAFVGLVGGLMFWWSNRTSVDPRKLRAETQEILTKLVAAGTRVKGFEEGESITVDKAKEAILALIDADLKGLNEEVERAKARAKKDDKYRPPDKMLMADINSLTALKQMKDAWGQPLVFSMADNDTLQIEAKGKLITGDPIEPVTVKMRAAKKPEKTDKTEKTDKAKK